MPRITTNKRFLNEEVNVKVPYLDNPTNLHIRKRKISIIFF